jgi:acetolactate synthase-1/2/3 large subunit
VLIVGSGTGDLVTNAWKLPGPGTTIIQIDIDPSELGRSFPNTFGIMGDAKVTLQRLTECVGHEKNKRQWSQQAQNRVQQWRAEVDPLLNSDKVPIQPERLCKALTEVLPSNGILVADTGSAAVWSGTMVYLTHPGQRYIRCAGSLGWALPASLGAKCAAPDRPVICFTGDGGFWYHLSELETARRSGIRTVTVVNNNHGLGQCRSPLRRIFGDEPGKSDEMWAFRDTNFAKIAKEMGCLSMRIERPEEISGAIQTALSADIPSVVEVITDVECQLPDASSTTQPQKR